MRTALFVVLGRSAGLFVVLRFPLTLLKISLLWSFSMYWKVCRSKGREDLKWRRRFLATFVLCLPAPQAQTTADRSAPYFTFVSLFERLFGFWRVVLAVHLLLKDRRSHYCSFPKFAVFRIEPYLSLYLWMLITFNKGYFETVNHATGKEWFLRVSSWY